MRPFVQLFCRAAEGINRIAVVISELALLALMLITVYAVIARYLFRSPSVYAVEVSTYILLLVAWAAVGWVHHLDRHVSMEALNLRLTGTWRRISNAISELTILVFCAVLVWSGSNVVLTSIERGYRSASLLKFPLWVAYTLIPLGAVLLGVIALRRLIQTALPNSEIPKKAD